MKKRRKLVSLKDVAKEANVSMSTVSFALNEPNRISAGTRRHVLRIVKEQGYNRVKKGKPKGYIGIVSDYYNNMICGEFYNVVVMGILEELKDKDSVVILDSTRNDPEYFPKMITRGLVDGALFLGPCSSDLIDIAKQKNIPIVLVGHPMPDKELHSVVPDGRSGAFQATKHLIGLGHKKIGIVTGRPAYDPIAAERLEGYLYALSQSGIAERKDFIAEADFCTPKSAISAAHKLLELPDPPTALFCSSDSLAYRTYIAVKEKGLSIPQDISVVGFDDITAPDYASLPSPKLTSVHIDRMQMGKSSVDLLIDIINNTGKPVYRHTLNVELAIKESTAPPRR